MRRAFKNLPLAWKLVCFLLTGGAAVFLAVISYNYYSAKAELLNSVEREARNLTYATGGRIQSSLRAVEKVGQNVASLLGQQEFDEDALKAIVERAVQNNSDIYGFSIAFEPFAFRGESEFHMPYCHRTKSGALETLYLGGNSYQYHYLDWYQIPRELKRESWSDPYVDTGGGGVLMSTFSVPFYSPKTRALRGVVGTDVSLNWLQQIIASVRVYRTGYAFVLGPSGIFISHPARNWIMNESVFSVAEARNDPAQREIGKRMIHGEEGFAPIKEFSTGARSWIYFAPLGASGNSVGVIFPEAELFAPIDSLSRRLLLIGALGFALLCTVVALASSSVTRPLKLLTTRTAEIAKGNLEVELPATDSGDEIGHLTRSFQEMRVSLRHYIANLAETTAAKERIESELKIANAIQMSFLPKKFPPFPERRDFEIYAAIEPAREVGGDLYDFALIDDNTLYFAIGDVSGKGVPAALFMAVTKTLLKGTAGTVGDPAELLRRVNFELCQENSSAMFVTIFCGFLKLDTGELRFANAGHNPPVILREGRAPEMLQMRPGIMLGTFDTAQFITETTRMASGDMLLLYTDGVTEAADTEERFYGEEQLLAVTREVKRGSATQLVRQVMRSVLTFAGEAEQADDITVLALRVAGH